MTDVSGTDSDTGDLGLGEGLKPGALVVNKKPKNKSKCHINNNMTSKFHIISFDPDVTNLETVKSNSTENLHRPNSGKMHSFLEKMKKLRRSKSFQGELQRNNKGEEIIPVSNEIPFGTSLRQQKKLMAQELEKLRELHIYLEQNGTKVIDVASDEENQSESHVKEKMLFYQKLHESLEAVDLLKFELEMCHKQLEAKQEAIKILKGQLEHLQEEQSKSEHKEKELHKSLQQEVNKLQFDLEHQQSSLMDSQQTWAERFNEMSQENVGLRGKLQDRSDEIRKLESENTALKRDREELLALVDVQERHRYKVIKSTSTDAEYNTFTGTQLAVLGACHCHSNDLEPCSCAKAAANSNKQLESTKQKMEEHKASQEESLVIIDAYRIAFEEQLTRNSALMRQLADVASCTTQPSKTQKAKAAISWLISQLNEECVYPVPSRLPASFGPPLPAPPSEPVSEQSDQDLIYSLLDVIKDRSEALAHQRLAARMLANKNKELQKKLSEAE